MIAVVVYGQKECSVAKSKIYDYDLVIFIEQPEVVAVYPLCDYFEDLLKKIKSLAFERNPRNGFIRNWSPYNTTEFVFPMSEEEFLDMLREFVPAIEINSWRKQTRGQRAFMLCLECRENCKVCMTKNKG